MNWEALITQLIEAARDLAHDRTGLAIRLDTAEQRELKAPLIVSIGGDRGEGALCNFTLLKSGKASDVELFKDRFRNGVVDWPLRVTITAADDEIVRGVVYERMCKLESRYIPAATK